MRWRQCWKTCRDRQQRHRDDSDGAVPWRPKRAAVADGKSGRKKRYSIIGVYNSKNAPTAEQTTYNMAWLGEDTRMAVLKVAVGEPVGAPVGSGVGGGVVGASVGTAVGCFVGAVDGAAEGAVEGDAEGAAVGDTEVGELVGALVGWPVGAAVGLNEQPVHVGPLVGSAVGAAVGLTDGAEVVAVGDTLVGALVVTVGARVTILTVTVGSGIDNATAASLIPLARSSVKLAPVAAV